MLAVRRRWWRGDDRNNDLDDDEDDDDRMMTLQYDAGYDAGCPGRDNYSTLSSAHSSSFHFISSPSALCI